MSVKKLLATILALTMVLTMASFPAFAEGEASTVVPDSVVSDLAPEGSYVPVNGIIDGNKDTSGGHYFKSARSYSGGGTTVFGSFVFDFGAPYNLTEIYFNMGGCHMIYGKLYGSSTTKDPAATEGWEPLCELGSQEQGLVYTDAAVGKEITVDITHEGYYPYFKIEVMKLSQNNPLVWLESTFKATENPNKESVGYTVNYVDEDENVIDTYNGTGYVGYTVTESPIEIDGYKAPEGSETITLDADPTKNVITFTYTKITADTPVAIDPIGVKSPFSTRADYSLWGLIDGVSSSNSNLNYYRIAPYIKGTGEKLGANDTTTNFNFIVDFGNAYKVTRFMPVWGGQYATSVALWGSNDGKTFVLIGDFTGSASKQDHAVTDEGYYRYVKVEAYNTLDNNTACLEVSFEGVLSPDAILSSTVKATTNMVQDKEIKYLINGVAYKSDWPDYDYFASGELPQADEGKALGSVVFEFAAPTNLTEIWFNMGTCHMKYGKLYGSNTTSDPDASGWTDLSTFDNLQFTDANALVSTFAKETTAAISHEGYYKYFKVEITELSQAGNIVWLETLFRGTEGTATPDEPGVDDTITALGATIRLEKNGLSAGIRFGASIDKELAGIVGDYEYTDGADVKFGMFMLPEEMLDGNATLAAYLEAQDDDIGDALDIVARNILKQDENVIEYTAVLTRIPEGAWNQRIVAVPYMLTDGEYTYFGEKTQSYIGVAQAAIDSYVNGNPNEISVEDYNTLLEIVG